MRTREPQRVRTRARLDQRLHACLHRRARAVPHCATLPGVTVAFLPALEQARLVREGEVSSVELVQEYLDRIEQIDPQVNAYVTVSAEQALAEARSPQPGPFSGVPLRSDLVETAGIRTTFSCKAFANHVPKQDVEVVRRLRAAGFVLLGKTNTPSSDDRGHRVRAERRLPQPWDLLEDTGWSERRAAAAVAAGSRRSRTRRRGRPIRIPASCCGSSASSPPRGRVSPAPYGTRTDRARPGRSLARWRTLLRSSMRSPARCRRLPTLAPPPKQPSQRRSARHLAGCASPSRSSLASGPRRPCLRRGSAGCSRLLEELGARAGADDAATDRQTLELFAVVWQTIPTLYPVEDTSLMEPRNAPRSPNGPAPRRASTT